MHLVSIFWCLLEPSTQLGGQASPCSFFLMLLLPSMATSITMTVLWYSPATTMSGWLAITSLWVWIWKSHRIVTHLFSIFGGDFHLDPGTSPAQSRYFCILCQLPDYFTFFCDISMQAGPILFLYSHFFLLVTFHLLFFDFWRDVVFYSSYCFICFNSFDIWHFGQLCWFWSINR